MYFNNDSENFTNFYFEGKVDDNPSMSSACGNGGGGGCYNCKCHGDYEE